MAVDIAPDTDSHNRTEGTRVIRPELDNRSAGR